jgi:hypothetical protein
MKIVNILGGLGNQMFQYALALALKEKCNDEVKIDPRAFHGYPIHNGYELKRIFKVEIPEATIKEVVKLAYPFYNYRIWQLCKFLPRRHTMKYEGISMAYDERVFENNVDEYLIGYWQTENYFCSIRQNILKAFSFPPFKIESMNEKFAYELQQKCSVSIHIRRGDYLKINNTFGICSTDYYTRAIIKIQKMEPVDLFVIFSDDIDWCIEQFKKTIGNISVKFVNWNKGTESFRDMQLMSLCKHNIIANSSFSWWGAWLNQNPNKIVIAPSRWMNSKGWSEIIPHEWITIKV